MPFVPTQEQIDSLYMLLTQLRRESVKVRLVRFINWSEDIKDCELRIFCFEDEDRYKIFWDGNIEQI